jgi:hypothetical protein
MTTCNWPGCESTNIAVQRVIDWRDRSRDIFFCAEHAVAAWEAEKAAEEAYKIALARARQSVLVAAGVDLQQQVAGLVGKRWPGGCDHCQAEHEWQPESPTKVHMFIYHSDDCTRDVADDL